MIPSPNLVDVPNPGLLSDIAPELLAEEAISREARQSGRPPGPVSGFVTLDEQLGGFLAPGVHTLLAAPGSGKTALALQMSGTCDCPAMIVSSEMRRPEILRRIISRTTNTYLGRLRGGQMTPDELRARIAAAAQACPMLALYDATDQAVTADEIQRKADALRKRFDSPYILIMIDSVTDWALNTVQTTGSDAGLSEYAVTEAALSGLKAIATNLACPVLAIAHRNRQGHKAQGADKLHTAKATGRFEYVSESVWDLDRDPTNEPDADGRTPAELLILKNRHGTTGLSIPLLFEGRLQKFTEY